MDIVVVSGEHPLTTPLIVICGLLYNDMFVVIIESQPYIDCKFVLYVIGFVILLI